MSETVDGNGIPYLKDGQVYFFMDQPTLTNNPDTWSCPELWLMDFAKLSAQAEQADNTENEDSDRVSTSSDSDSDDSVSAISSDSDEDELALVVNTQIEVLKLRESVCKRHKTILHLIDDNRASLDMTLDSLTATMTNTGLSVKDSKFLLDESASISTGNGERKDKNNDFPQKRV